MPRTVKEELKQGTNGRAKLCPTAAETHANLMISMYGKHPALAKAERKRDDAPFLVNGDVRFWRDVCKAIAGQMSGDEILADVFPI
jgi:hypothetical protein